MTTANNAPAFVLAHDNLSILGRTPADNVWDPKTWITVPFVGPRGEFKWMHFDRRRNNQGQYHKQLRGLTPLKFDDGQVVLSKYGRLNGFTVYEDICNGTARVLVQDEWRLVSDLHPNVDGDSYWRMWLAFCKFNQQGKRVAAAAASPGALMDKFTEQLYHPEIKRRREEFAMYGEINALDQDAAIKIIMGDNFDPRAGEANEPVPATADDILAAGRKPKK